MAAGAVVLEVGEMAVVVMKLAEAHCHFAVCSCCKGDILKAIAPMSGYVKVVVREGEKVVAWVGGNRNNYVDTYWRITPA